ncbi:MAG: ABC transporter substrate-binding protein [Deinococcota bacterium]
MKRIIMLITALVILSASNALAQSGTLRLYTSQPDADAARTAEAFEALYPDVTVEIFRSGTEEVIGRLLLEAEAGEPQADVLLVADAPTFEILKAEELLEPYMSPEAEAIDAIYYDPEGFYYGTKIIATVIVYNTDMVDTPISTWSELAALDAGQVAMPSPSYSGAAAYNLGVLSRTDGIGFAYYEALEGRDVFLTQGNGAVFRSVAGGELPYGMMIDFLPIREAQAGAPVAVVYPDEGVPAITEPAGIIRGTQNPEAARAFIDFLLSEEGQSLAADMGYLPLRADVTAPAGFPDLADITVLSVDAATLAETRDADKERFAELFGE